MPRVHFAKWESRALDKLRHEQGLRIEAQKADDEAGRVARYLKKKPEHLEACVRETSGEGVDLGVREV